MPVQPYTKDDLEMGENIVRELHGLQGFKAWAERIAKALAAEREEAAHITPARLLSDMERAHEDGRQTGLEEAARIAESCWVTLDGDDLYGHHQVAAAIRAAKDRTC